ncbi:MAG: hypothetical protein JXB50_12870 [Spirochaetes bacterium]|nr:hypothetical protein [Spirochaetota bacterium]
MKKIDFTTYHKDIYLDDAYYTIRWSNYLKYEKYEILKKLPELPGIFIIFYLNKRKKLMPFFLGYSWVGSLRHDIKALSDPYAPVEKEVYEIIQERECFYKYLIVPTYSDLLDLYEFIKSQYENIDYVQVSEGKESGRYNNVFVKEYSEEK